MSDPDRVVWPSVLSHLREHHADLSRQWFEELEPVGTARGVFHVRAGSRIHQRYLQRECGGAFADAMQASTGRLLPVTFLSPEDPTPVIEVKTPKRAPKAEASPTNAASMAAGADSLGGEAPNGGANPPADGQAVGLGRQGGTSMRYGMGTTGTPIVGKSAIQQPSGSAIADGGGRFDAGLSRARAHGHGGVIRTSSEDDLIINPDYTFDNFVVGPENRLAYAAARAVADAPGEAYNPLFLHGGVGLGKSHLLQAICLTIMERPEKPRIHYVSCDTFLTEFHVAVQAGQLSDFRHRFRDIDIIVIDDIHFLTKHDQTQEEFFHTFNALYQHPGKQIVLSSDAAPQDIPDLEARLVSRFQCGLVVQILPPGYETRVQVARRKAKLRGIDLPDDVACYIAAKVTTNIREIEGAIMKVQALARADQVEISETVARQALNDEVPEIRPEVTITNIIDAVVDHYGVKLTDLQSKRRQKSIAHPRQVCMYLARKYTRYSLEEIGGYFGGRDHTTVMHAVKTIESRRDADEEFGRVVEAFERRFDGPSPPRN